MDILSVYPSICTFKRQCCPWYLNERERENNINEDVFTNVPIYVGVIWVV